MAPNNKNFGYTLFEILVVVAIILLFSGLSLAYYNSFNEQKRLEGEAKKFVETLELAKKKTISGDKPCTDYSGNYRVSWTSVSPYTYTLTSMGCSDQSVYTLPSNFSFLSAGNVTFEPFGLGSNSACLIIKNDSSGKCRKVSVEGSANIEEQIESDCACP